jgi:hypothetical protein
MVMKMKPTTVNHGQIPLDPNKLIQFLVTQEAWGKDRIKDVEEWAEAYQLLITKVRNGEFTMPFPDRMEINGNAFERFDALRDNPNNNLTMDNWRVWYNGWMEGRFALYGKLFGLGG